MLAVKFELLLTLLDDLVLSLLEFVGAAGFGGEGEFLLLALLVGLADGLGLLLAALLFLSFDLSESLFKQVLGNWVALDLTRHGLRLRDDLGLGLGQVKRLWLSGRLLRTVIIVASC